MTANKNSAFQFDPTDRIGRVASVDTSRVAVDVTNSALLTRIAIGGIIAIRGSTEQDYLIAITERVTRNSRDSLAPIEGDEGELLLEVAPTDLLQAVFIGNFPTGDGGKSKTFKRCAHSFPQIDRDCFL